MFDSLRPRTWRREGPSHRRDVQFAALIGAMTDRWLHRQKADRLGPGENEGGAIVGTKLPEVTGAAAHGVGREKTTGGTETDGNKISPAVGAHRGGTMIGTRAGTADGVEKNHVPRRGEDPGSVRTTAEAMAARADEAAHGAEVRRMVEFA